MRNRLIAAAVASIVLAPVACFAQASTVTGTVGGATAGAIVGGPVGAIVGGTIGATVGAIAEPPKEVRVYVERQEVPSVTVEKKVVVGQPLPPRVTLHTIPDAPKYRFAMVNNERVIVEPRSRKVIQIIE